jgi:hypothetical protein
MRDLNKMIDTETTLQGKMMRSIQRDDETLLQLLIDRRMVKCAATSDEERGNS